ATHRYYPHSPDKLLSSCLDIGARRGTIAIDLRDHHSVSTWDFEIIQQGCGKPDTFHPQPRAEYLAELNQLLDYLLCGVSGDRKPNPHTSAARRENLRVDPNNFPTAI